jgi:hypothetical protein
MIQGIRMRKIVLAATATFGAMALAACSNADSEGAADETEMAADEMVRPMQRQNRWSRPQTRLLTPRLPQRRTPKLRFRPNSSDLMKSERCDVFAAFGT